MLAVHFMIKLLYNLQCNFISINLIINRRYRGDLILKQVI
jgi:hypothetical protein